MKTTKTFENASLVSVVDGSIKVKSAAGIEHTFTNASIVSVNNGTIIIETEWEPKKGEWVKAIGCGIDCYIIFSSKSTDVLYTYGSIDFALTLTRYNILGDDTWRFNHMLQLLPVTPEEQKAFEDFCKSQGKIWNREKLQWENYRWKPNKNDIYYYISSVGWFITSDTWDNWTYDIEHYAMGNCFKTKEEAEAKLEEIKKILNPTI